MTMTRKDFTAIAQTIAYQRQMALDMGESVHALDYTTLALCGIFHQSNPNFDKNKFLHACGLSQYDV